MMDCFAMLKDPALMQKKEDEMKKKQSECEADLKSILEKCFDYYDTSKTQSLGPKVSGDLFSHYIIKQSRLLLDLQEQKEKKMMTESADMVAQMMGPMPPMLGSHEGEKQEVLMKMDEHFERVRKLMEEQIAEYQADKVKRDAAALEVLDVNGDGKLQKAEVVEGLLPSTATNNAFMRALGINLESLPKLNSSEVMGFPRAGRRGKNSGSPDESKRRVKPSSSPDECKQQ